MRQRSKWKTPVIEPSAAPLAHGSSKSARARDEVFMESVEMGQVWTYKGSKHGAEIVGIDRIKKTIMLKHSLRDRVTKVTASTLRNMYKQEN